ncbi:response regulator [Pseudogemmobacter humi]|uniref:histidine kinase n=1 Tax=Pseudogemmobacter humi TaxID=2483812 RepID=A0A3P5WPH3_9RHOB|nr:response regulator [Pseudogemmobacter humi]VDC21150.1 Sensor protein EvgS precursor [Pseudogemmobacter humi]
MIPAQRERPHAGAADNDPLALLAAILATDSRGTIVFSAKGELLLANAAVGAALVAQWHGFGSSADWARARDQARRTGSAPVALTPGLSGELSLVAPDDSQAGWYLLRLAEDAGESEAALRAGRIAAMAHDLRAPLQSLMIAADTLAGQPGGDARAAEIGALAQLALDQMRNLLETARMDEVSAHVEPVETFDLTALVRDMARLLDPICRRSDNHIVLEIPERPHWHRGAPHLIRAVLQNLITNANRFNMNGPVTVRLRLDPSESEAEPVVTLEVEDVGPGLSDAERQLLLKPRRSLSPSASAGGYGMGLGIVSRAVSRLRGKITAEPGEERGTLFRISFPLGIAQGPDDTAAPAAGNPVSLAGLKILVVEDNPVNLAILLRTLADAGAGAEGVTSGQDALNRITATGSGFDLILLDITLPDIDGIEVARRVRAAETGDESILIVGLTAHVRAVVHGSGLAAGMNHILIKPVSPSELRRALRALWDGVRPRQQDHKQGREVDMMLNERLVEELVDEMGREASLSFMRQALAEAREVLAVFRSGGDDAHIRHRIHSAIGSAGLTGLAGVEYGLRRLQGDARAGTRSDEAAALAADMIDKTGAQLEKLASAAG